MTYENLVKEAKKAVPKKAPKKPAKRIRKET